MRLNLLSTLTLALLILNACSSDPSTDKVEKDESVAESAKYDKLISDKLSLYKPLPALADNPENTSNPTKIKLGHMLYYDTRLSKDQTQSCNSCHNLATYGVDNLPTSPGDLGENGERNSPTTLNAALHFKQFWDGRAADVEEQAGGPVLNPVEMNIPSEAFLVERLKSDETYRTLFAEAFPEETQPLTYWNIQRAIASFERQLLTPSRFDDYLRGDMNALTLNEKKGFLSFALIGCATCHNGSLLGGNQLQRFGVHKDYWEATGSEHIDKGLAAQTNEELDEFMFKVPSLRNITETHPYFHDGSVKDLKEAIRIMADIQLDYQMNNEELKNVMSFMEALKGEVPQEYQQNPLASAE